MTEAIQALEHVGDAELWLVDLDACATWHQQDCLSSDEEARSARFVFERDRLRYRSAHSALRHLLAAHTGRSPRSLRITSGTFGKPVLHDDPSIQFNLSHSQDMALIGIGQTPLGVDVEKVRPIEEWSALAAVHFTDSEQFDIASQPISGQERAFLRCWTRKEACLKALGLGLSLDTRDIDVVLERPDPLTSIVFTPEHGSVAVQSFALGRSAIASVALVIPPEECGKARLEEACFA